MALTDIIVCTTILEVDASTSKAVVIERLLQELAAAGHVSAAHVPSLLQAVLQREAMASTAIGNGVAVPHVKHAAAERAIGILGLCGGGVNFDSIDGRPTDIVMLLLAPPNRPGMAEPRPSRSSGELLRLLGDERFRTRLRQAKSAGEIAEVLQSFDRSCFS